MPDFPYHQQNTGETCGPACLLMLREFMGEDPHTPSDKYSQLALHAKASITEDLPTPGIPFFPWLSAPDGMAKTARHVQGGVAPSDKVTYVVRAFPEELGPGLEAVSADANAAVATLSASLASGHPAFLLTEKGRHWVLAVRMLPGGKIEVRNPWPPKHEADARHRKHTSAGTPCCPTQDASVVGTKFTKKAIKENPNTYGAKWCRKHVVVAPEGIALRMMMMAGPPSPEADGPTMAAASGGMLDPGQAKDAAFGHVRDVAEASPEWRERFKGLTPGDPILAERLEDEPPLARYYIVPLLDEFGKTGGLVNVDATDGELYEVRIVPRGSALWWPTHQFTEERVLEAAQGKTFQPPGSGVPRRSFNRRRASVLRWETGHLAGQPKLVWQCCAQSLTPFQPFYQIADAGGTSVWLDFGQELHGELDISKGGG